jgi:hypothetical protein
LESSVVAVVARMLETLSDVVVHRALLRLMPLEQISAAPPAVVTPKENFPAVNIAADS